MNSYASDVAFTPSVKAIQKAKGSRDGYARMEEKGGWQTKVTAELAAFLGSLDMFYLATATADGQPYIQYRGGAAGFLKPIDDQTLAFADFAGNQQYISFGNLVENPKAFIFLIDYVNQRRIKLWGKAKIVEDDPELLARVADAEYAVGRPERVIVFDVEAWDINCPQHIHKRYPHAAVARTVEELQEKVKTLEAELAALRPE